MSANQGREFAIGDRVMWRDKYSPRRYGVIEDKSGIDYIILRSDGVRIKRGVGLSPAAAVDAAGPPHADGLLRYHHAEQVRERARQDRQRAASASVSEPEAKPRP